MALGRRATIDLRGHGMLSPVQGRSSDGIEAEAAPPGFIANLAGTPGVSMMSINAR